MSDATTPVILSACRTPIGRFLGGLAGFTAPQLGARAIREAISRAGIDLASIDEVIMGQVVQGGSGQAPARQAMIHGGGPRGSRSMGAGSTRNATSAPPRNAAA